MTKWNGMNRKSTPVDEAEGVLHYQENARMTVRGELRRRHGMSRSTVEKIATPIYGIASTVAPVAAVAIQGSNGSIFGYTGFTPEWGDVILLAPTGTAVQGGGSGLIAGDGTNRSVPYSQAATHFAGVLMTSDYIDSAAAINTGGVNGNTYQVTLSLTLNMADVAISLDSITLNATFSDYLDPLGYGNTWSFTGGVSGTQSNQSNSSASMTTADKSVLVVIDLNGATGPYAVTLADIVRLPGGATVQMVSGAFFATGISVPFTTTGTLAYTVLQESATPTDQWTITVNRADIWVESFDIVARDGGYPADASDGTLIGNLAIASSASSANTVYTMANTNSTWKFVAVPKRGSLSGPTGRLT